MCCYFRGKWTISWTLQIEASEKKKKTMSEQGFTEMVQKQREEIKTLQGIKQNYEKSKEKHDSEVEAIKKELKKVDDDIEELREVDEQLKRGIRLDSFEERCKYHCWSTIAKKTDKFQPLLHVFCRPLSIYF